MHVGRPGSRSKRGSEIVELSGEGQLEGMVSGRKR